MGKKWERRVQSNDRLKAMILEERTRSSSSNRSACSAETTFLRCRKSTMLAFSATLRWAMFRKFLKSLLEELPLPSAILLETLKAAARNCSA